jgi:uncharacterized protein YbjQ (UPF0145 family)
MRFIVVNRDHVEGYYVAKELGMVSAANVRSKNIILDIVVAFQGCVRHGDMPVTLSLLSPMGKEYLSP